MKDFCVQLGSREVPNAFVARFLNHLKASSAPRLREESTRWKSSPLRELGLSFVARVGLLASIRKEVSKCWSTLDAELRVRRDELRRSGAEGLAFQLDDRALYRDLLVGVDAFLFEYRAAIELLETFLLRVVHDVFDRKMDRTTLRSELIETGVDAGWVSQLSHFRDMVAHEVTLSLAVHVVSEEPWQWELVLQKGHPLDGGVPLEDVPWRVIQGAEDGLRSALQIIERWLFAQVEHYEDRQL